jgi:hypothetical protein
LVISIPSEELKNVPATRRVGSVFPHVPKRIVNRCSEWVCGRRIALHNKMRSVRKTSAAHAIVERGGLIDFERNVETLAAMRNNQLILGAAPRFFRANKRFVFDAV